MDLPSRCWSSPALFLTCSVISSSDFPLTYAGEGVREILIELLRVQLARRRPARCGMDRLSFPVARFNHATSRSLEDLTGHIGRRYLHIEAIFVFDAGLEHLSARAGGEPFRIAPAGQGADPMPKLIYRVVSACGALGYGYPRESLEAALRGQVDAIICDGGSMDAGPYYLGTGTEYFESEAVKLDFRHMVEAGARIGCPVILGSCGMAGGDRNLDWMIAIAKEVFGELGIQDAKVAVIRV